MGGRRELTGQVNAKYGSGPSIMFYTHVSDQHGPYYVQAFSGGIKEAPHMLDGLLYHETDLAIREHYTDTGAFTDQVFAAAHLLGYRFCPRIRDLADKRLYIFEKAQSYPALQPIIGGILSTSRMREEWEEVLRLMSSLRKGTVTASLILRKLAAYPRQNGLAWALREFGRLERSLFTLEWMQKPELRRRVQVGLNKGESRNSLARAVFFHRLGEVRERTYEDQRYRASGLNLLTACIVLWNTVYLAEAVEALRQRGETIDANLLEHVAPLGWNHIGLTGDYNWNFASSYEMGRLRPLRLPNYNQEVAS